MPQCACGNDGCKRVAVIRPGDRYAADLWFELDDSTSAKAVQLDTKGLIVIIQQAAQALATLMNIGDEPA